MKCWSLPPLSSHTPRARICATQAMLQQICRVARQCQAFLPVSSSPPVEPNGREGGSGSQQIPSRGCLLGSGLLLLHGEQSGKRLACNPAVRERGGMASVAGLRNEERGWRAARRQCCETPLPLSFAILVISGGEHAAHLAVRYSQTQEVGNYAVRWM
jgi:hypothetical protein